jgi:hypothetical protein
LILAAKPPDAPINLANVALITTGYQIGLLWEDGAYDGASPVIDYRVNIAQVSDGIYSVYADGVTENPLTITGLTPGVRYEFKVESRNIVNYSALSTSVSILAAQIPDAPTGLSDVPVVTLAT